MAKGVGEQSAARYFISKCVNFDSLHTAKETSVWACSDRKFGPQPKDFLREALEQQSVVLVYSVNNCHGWHGYATMLTAPGELETQAPPGGDSDLVATPEQIKKSGEHDVVQSETVWYRFRICWQKLYLWNHGEQGLPFTATENLECLDGTPVNKARNFQEISASVGQDLCRLIDEDYDKLTQKKEQKKEEKIAAVTPFFQPETEQDAMVVWQKLLKKVEGLGTVLMACVFGSQRYNLNTPNSDVDMFVVYQAPTQQVLGFNPPEQTIKNRDIESCDYTVHEVHRYCELLMSGDPRCVETLFLHPSTITHASPQWRHLCLHRQAFLTSQCLDKYLRDATGSKGTKQLSKWEARGEMKQDPLPAKVCKLSYIVLRLLQNARDVANYEELHVYREEKSAERELLMGVRGCRYSYAEIQQYINGLLADIERERPALDSKSPSNDTETVITNWILTLRYDSLQQYMTAQKSSGSR